MTSGTLLSVDDLRVTFPTEDGDVHAVRGVSFDVAAGETVGIVGESGSGKSVTAQSILQLVQGARISGSARFHDSELLSLPAAQMQRIRGARIAMVFQDPLSSLHPQFTVGWQIVEAIRAHRIGSRRARQAAGDRPARGGRHPRRRPSGRRLPAPVLRRDAPAGHAGDGAWRCGPSC